MKHLYLEGLANKVEYAQLLHDASEIKMSAAGRYSHPDPDTLVLELPIQRPDVLVPVIELFLKK